MAQTVNIIITNQTVQYIVYGDESNQFELIGEYAYGGFGNFIWDNW